MHVLHRPIVLLSMLALLTLWTSTHQACAQSGYSHYGEAGESIIDRLSQRPGGSERTGAAYSNRRAALPPTAVIPSPAVAGPQSTLAPSGQRIPSPTAATASGAAPTQLATSHRESFLRGSSSSKSGGLANSQIWTQLNKIALNLVIVLAIAAAAAVALKQYQQAKQKKTEADPADAADLRVLETLKLDSTTSLTLVNVQGTKVLVTQDASGNSVSILPPAFPEVLDQADESLEEEAADEHEQADILPLVRSRASGRREQRQRESKVEPAREPITPTGDLDEELVKLFVSRSKAA